MGRILAIIGLFLVLGLFFLKSEKINSTNNIAELILGVFNDKGPSEALMRLRSEMYRRPEINKDCHQIAHKVGRLAFDKSGNVAEAAKASDDICNSGYLHGVIEEYFKINKNDLTSIKNVCKGYENKTILWHCSHAIGHALMFIGNNDLRWALDFCNENYHGNERERCANGVFMENFSNTENILGSSYLRPNDFFYPCNDFVPEDEKPDCYMYAPDYIVAMNPGNYAKAFEACDQVKEGINHNYCISGAGSRLLIENTTNIDFVNEQCMNLTVDGRYFCFVGVAWRYLGLYRSEDGLKNYCKKFDITAQKSCTDTTARYKDLIGFD